MWMAFHFEFYILRFLPFPFSYKNSRLHYDSSLDWKLLYWHLSIKLGLTFSILLCSSLLLKEIFKPSIPPLTMIKVLGLIVHVLVGILTFEFAMEFSTNGRGLLEIFNEVIKLHNKITIETIKPISRIHRLNSKKPFPLKRMKDKVLGLLTKEDSKIDSEGLIAMATAGLLFSPFPFVLIALQFDIDFTYFLIHLVVPKQYVLTYRLEFLLLRFVLFFYALIEIMRLSTFKLLLSEFVVKIMESNMKILCNCIRKFHNNQQFRSSIFPMYYQMSILVSYADYAFGNQFTTIIFATSATLIMIGFVVIRLHYILPIYATIFLLILYVCGHVGTQCILRNANHINLFSENFMRECKFRVNFLRNTKYWKRKLCSIQSINLSLRLEYCKVCNVKRSMIVSFIGCVAIYTINAVLGIPTISF